MGPPPTYIQTNFKFNINVASVAEGITDHVTLLRLLHMGCYLVTVLTLLTVLLRLVSFTMVTSVATCYGLYFLVRPSARPTVHLSDIARSVSSQ